MAFAYYAHHLSRGLPTAQGPDDDALDHLTPDETALATHWLESLDLPKVTAQGRLAIPLRHAAEMVAKRFSLDGRLTRAFIALCCREVAAYLRAPDAPTRHAAREEVASVIAERRPRIVIAHSLGTVVTYEALHAHPELTVDLFITLGSPLALPHGVFHRLLPAPVERGIRPPGVARWVNVSDHGDPVAILRPLRRYFDGVDLDLQESVRLFDFHRAVGYLRSPAVAAALDPYLPRR
ncbi:serine peptidase [Streptomyces sp. F001]|nr:serine peptidase [Streptomyces sp. F001]